MTPPDERGRPTANRAASNVSLNDDTNCTPRCRRCRRPLSAPQSIELGLGWRCAKQADAGARDLAPLGAWQAAIAEVIACAA